MLANPVVPSLREHVSMLQMLEITHCETLDGSTSRPDQDARIYDKGCLSRQLGEALTIFTTSDHLLNSKN